ncbi:hypothetical protein PoB_003231700 [Plakobranchus ocellatus]|uniref:Uncharacterized protein n=1 Tax=Plakobranchus ocellatus TaxID=259542 RepID=A0AAV4AEZ2_9GAST|nr:hypothetical protein PoB_003231700 [Plakobranchus ocellatus]
MEPESKKKILTFSEAFALRKQMIKSQQQSGPTKRIEVHKTATPEIESGCDIEVTNPFIDDSSSDFEGSGNDGQDEDWQPSPSDFSDSFDIDREDQIRPKNNVDDKKNEEKVLCP